MRILTNINIPQSKEWNEKTDLIPYQNKYCSNLSQKSKKVNAFEKLKSYWNDIKIAVNIYANKDKGDVIVLGTGNISMVFALLNKCSFRRVPLIVLGSYIERQSNILLYYLKRNLLKLMDLIVVFTTQEIENYSKYFKLDKKKFKFLAFGHTLSNYEYEVEEGDYIFCSGDGVRDYKTFVEAIRGMPIKAVIPCRDPSVFKDINVPKNIEIKTVSADEYRKLMGKSRIVVVPIRKGLMIGGGVQSYLNAMCMGKAVIVSDVAGARDYINDRRDGLIVEPGSVDELREAINYLLNNRDEAKQIGRNAKAIVEGQYSLSRYINDLMIIIEELFLSKSQIKQ